MTVSSIVVSQEIKYSHYKRYFQCDDLQRMGLDDHNTLLIYLYHGFVHGSLMLYILIQKQISGEISYRTLEYVYVVGLLYMIYQYQMMYQDKQIRYGSENFIALPAD